MAVTGLLLTKCLDLRHRTPTESEPMLRDMEMSLSSSGSPSLSASCLGSRAKAKSPTAKHLNAL